MFELKNWVKKIFDGPKVITENAVVPNEKYDYSSQLYALQIELSTNCNALCLGCVRTNDNYTATKEQIPKNQLLKKQVLLDLLTSKNGRRIKRLEFCGNIDEPLAYPQLLELLEDLYLLNPNYTVELHTNGSLRDKNFHKSLGTSIRRFHKGSRLRYALDGLEDTHKIYRQNTSYEKIEENMKAAIESGAEVIWQYLVFPWNTHQVERAQQRAQEIGCKEIWFRPDRSLTTLRGLAYVEVLKNIEGYTKKIKFDYTDHWPRKVDEEIKCRFKQPNQTMMFLSWEGKIWPCCFLSNVFYEDKKSVDQFKEHALASYERNFNSLYHHSFDDILSHPFFREQLMKSWEDPNDKRAWRCTSKCRENKIRTSDQKNDQAEDFGIKKLRF